MSSTRNPRFSGQFFDLNKLLNQKLVPQADDDFEESIRSTEFDIKQLKASVQGHQDTPIEEPSHEDAAPITDRSAVT